METTAASLSPNAADPPGDTLLKEPLGELLEKFRQAIKLLLATAQISSELRAAFEAVLSAPHANAFEEKLDQALELARSLTEVEGNLPPPGDSPGSAKDPCTGLPLQTEAETIIQNALSGPFPCYVASFYIHRMGLINARFGEAIGNQVIQFCSQHIAGNLSPNDKLFRWRGPGFVALLERNESALAIASEVQRFAGMPLSRFFETPSRTVYLPIKMTAEVLPATGRTFEDVMDQVQTSLHAHGLADG